MASPSASDNVTRPLDAMAAAIVVMLCLSWGFNQVATKLAIHDITPLTQATIRSVVAALLIACWCKLRHIPIFTRDGTLLAGVMSGVLFSGEFILIYQGLVYTTATRGTLFLYLAPFFVVLGTRIVLPVDRFHPAQWLGLALSFAGMVLAFGLPTPAVDPRQMLGDVMMVGAAIFWAATTLLTKASSLSRVSAEKMMLYQLVVSAPIIAAAAWLVGERLPQAPSALALGALAYQTVWVVSIPISPISTRNMPRSSRGCRRQRRRRRRNGGRATRTAKNSTASMNAFCAPAARPRARAIGGTATVISARPPCCRRTDGSRTAATKPPARGSTISRTRSGSIAATPS